MQVIAFSIFSTGMDLASVVESLEKIIVVFFHGIADYGKIIKNSHLRI